MKIMFASDIHGSFLYCSKLIENYKKEEPEMLVLAGDLLYHGPRNKLPVDYDTANTIELLNSIKEHIVCVRGNCDAEVDQMVLNFDISSDYKTLYIDGRTFFVTHGHIYNNERLPLLKQGDVLVNGHTHIYALENRNTYYYTNPGSVAIPKGATVNSYMIYDDKTFIIKDMEMNVIKQMKI